MRENNDFNYLRGEMPINDEMNGGLFNDLTELADTGVNPNPQEATMNGLDQDDAIDYLDTFDRQTSLFAGVNEDPTQLLSYAGKSFRLINSQCFPKLDLKNLRKDWDKERYGGENFTAKLLLFADQFTHDETSEGDEFDGDFDYSKGWVLQTGACRLFPAVPAEAGVIDEEGDEDGIDEPSDMDNVDTVHIKLTADNVPGLIYTIINEETDAVDEIGDPLPVAIVDDQNKIVAKNPGTFTLIAQVPEDQKTTIEIDGIPVTIPNDQLLRINIKVKDQLDPNTDGDYMVNPDIYTATDENGDPIWNGYNDLEP